MGGLLLKERLSLEELLPFGVHNIVLQILHANVVFYLVYANQLLSEPSLRQLGLSLFG